MNTPEPSTSGWQTLSEEEIGERLQAAAETASQLAKADLLAKGIGYVYDRDGVVYRRMPDGTEQVVWTALF